MTPREEFDRATAELHFTKDFNSALDAVIRDKLATSGQRVLAWIKRRAWGKYSLYCVNDDGTPACQSDCERELSIDKTRISHTMAYLRKRGYVRKDGKLIYPVIDPVPEADPEKVAGSRNFQSFFEEWKVANSSNFATLEVARSTIKEIRKVVLSDYKKWRAAQTNTAPSLSESKREFLEKESSSSSGLSSVGSGTTTTPIPDPEPETPTQPAESPASLDPLPKIIYDAFSACVKKPFSRNSAKPRVADARRVAAKLGEPLSDKDIADCIRIFEADPKKVDSIGFYIKTLPEKVEALLEFRQRECDDAADRARAGWVCPECNGYGRVRREVRGIGVNERCICQQQAKGA